MTPRPVGLGRPARPKREYYWADPPIATVGVAQGASGPDDDTANLVGPLWVPDPEQRHGWREYYVRASPKPGSERRPMGFRKP